MLYRLRTLVFPLLSICIFYHCSTVHVARIQLFFRAQAEQKLEDLVSYVGGETHKVNDDDQKDTFAKALRSTIKQRVDFTVSSELDTS